MVTPHQETFGQAPQKTLAKARPCRAGRQACMQADSLRNVIGKAIGT